MALAHPGYCWKNFKKERFIKAGFPENGAAETSTMQAVGLGNDFY